MPHEPGAFGAIPVDQPSEGTSEAAVAGEQTAPPPVVPSEGAIDVQAGTSVAADVLGTKRKRAGRFAGMGYPRAWIADRFGVTPQTVANWEDTPDFVEAYMAEEGRQARAADMALTKIALTLPQLVDTSIAVALDPGHKDSSVERRYLIDKVLTPMTIQHGTMTLQADVRFWQPVAAALERVSMVPRAAIPALLDGAAAAEEYGAVPTGGNGSAALTLREVGHTDGGALAPSPDEPTA
jgi:hypothetical protein